MNIVDLSLRKFSNDRTLFRKKLTNIFLDEPPGTGTGLLATRTHYHVRQIGPCEVYLKRPAQLNNGLDFTLHVSNINFNNGLFKIDGSKKNRTTRPSHSHIITDLISKKNENQKLYSDFLSEIDLIYKVNPRSSTVFNFTQGHDSEIILECIKWLFVEQDITYWHNSGRAMLYNSIKSI